MGSRVLLKKCAFTVRHKLVNRYGDQCYVVVSANDDLNLYEVRPALGGPAKWLNRKLLVLDPRGEPNRAPVVLDVLPRIHDNDPGENSDDEAYTSSEFTGEASPSSTVVEWRPSDRANKDRHSNPAHLPGGGC